MADDALPLVSVVVPAYNSELHIGEALTSALAQDYPSIEIIVVDDGSTDTTADIAATFAPRVRLLRQPNLGAAAARNLGVANTRGHYVAFLDADDVWWSHKLTMQILALRDSGHGLAYSRFLRWRKDRDGNYPEAARVFENPALAELSDGDLLTGWPYAELLLDCIVWTSTVVVEKLAIDRVGGFDVTLRKGQDYDLWLRLSREISMVALDTPTALYRLHEASITSDLTPTNYGYTLISRAVDRFGLKGPDGREPPAGSVEARLAKLALNHGLAHLQRGDPRIALDSLREAIRHGGRGTAKPSLAMFWVLALARCGFERLRPRQTEDGDARHSS